MVLVLFILMHKTKSPQLVDAQQVAGEIPSVGKLLFSKGEELWRCDVLYIFIFSYTVSIERKSSP